MDGEKGSHICEDCGLSYIGDGTYHKKSNNHILYSGFMQKQKLIENEISKNVKQIEKLRRRGFTDKKIIIMRKDTSDPSHWRNQEEKDLYNKYFMEDWGDEIFYKNSLGLYCLLHIL